MAKLRARATTYKSKKELRKKQMRIAKKQAKTMANKPQDRRAHTLHHGLPHEMNQEEEVEEDDNDSDSSSDSEAWDSDEELPPLHPDRRCIELENAVNDPVCWEQWDLWESYCDYVDWNDQCEAVDETWFSQDLDWVYPPTLERECATHWDNMTDECWDQYNLIWDMCMMEGDYEDTPVMWTTTCDAVESLEWAFEDVDEALYEEWTGEEEEVDQWWPTLLKRRSVLSKKHAMREAKNPARYSLSLMGKTAAVEEPSSGFDTSAAFGGFAIGFTAMLAFQGIRSLMKPKKTVKQAENT